MELAAICVVLATCAMLIVLVIGAGISDYRRHRVRLVLEDRLRPYEGVTIAMPKEEVTVIDLRDKKPSKPRAKPRAKAKVTA